MDLKTKKVSEYFFWKLQIFFLKYTIILGSGTRMVRNLNITFTRKNGRLEMFRGQNQKKEESVFEEAGTDPKNSKQRT